MFSIGQVLMLALDSVDTIENSNWKMYMNWSICGNIQWFFAWSFLAMGIFYSSSDESKSFVSSTTPP